MEPSRETTVLFAAIIGAGDLREKAGDKAAHEAIERCQFRLGQAAASCGARLMKSTAEKVMVLAATPDAAADAASAMHLAMEKLPKTADVKLALGIGFHFGPVIQKGDEVFGDTVNLAARLCEHAGSGQIITTEWTAKLLSPLYRAWLRKLETRSSRAAPTRPRCASWSGAPTTTPPRSCATARRTSGRTTSRCGSPTAAGPSSAGARRTRSPSGAARTAASWSPTRTPRATTAPSSGARTSSC